MIQKVNNSKLGPTSSTLFHTFETQVNKILNNARDEIGAYVIKSLTKYNSLKDMVLAGSKGSNINISQVNISFYFQFETCGLLK